MAVAVTFGGVLGTNVQVASDTELTVTTPAHAAGVVDVTVTTSGGSDTLTGGFTYLDDEPDLDLTVPSPIAVTVGEQATYSTNLSNAGAEVASATETLTLHSEDRDLVEADVVYETFDGGAWVTADFDVVGGDLVASETYPVPAGLDADSDVRITVVADDLTDLSGESEIVNDDGGAVLATATYEYTITAAPVVPTLTAVDPATVTAPAAPGTFTVTGVDLDLVGGSTGTAPYILGLNPNPDGQATPLALPASDITAVSDTELTFTRIFLNDANNGTYALVLFDGTPITVDNIVESLDGALTVNIPPA
jgi:large repetitive protein